jgi:hypothetical protein
VFKDGDDDEDDDDDDGGEEGFSQRDIDAFEKRQQEQLSEWQDAPEEPITTSNNPIVKALQKRIGQDVGIKYQNCYRVIVPIKLFRKGKYRKLYVSAIEDDEVKIFAMNKIQIVCPGCGSDEAIGRICPKCGYDLEKPASENSSPDPLKMIIPASAQHSNKVNLCKHCGCPMSKLADKCPHCNHPTAGKMVGDLGRSLIGCGCMLTFVGIGIIIIVAAMLHC